VVQVQYFGRPGDEALTATLNRNRPSRLHCPTPLGLRITVEYRVLPWAADARQWVAQTAAYYYALTDEDRASATLGSREILAFHWHPEARGAFLDPHLHVGAAWLGGEARISPKWHVPTGRVTLEEIIRFAIRHFDVKPMRGDFERVLTNTRAEVSVESNRL